MHLILTRVTPPCLFHLKDLLNNLSVHIFYVRVKVATQVFPKKEAYVKRALISFKGMLTRALYFANSKFKMF